VHDPHGIHSGKPAQGLFELSEIHDYEA
jgi:hypothetical protein